VCRKHACTIFLTTPTFLGSVSNAVSRRFRQLALSLCAAPRRCRSLWLRIFRRSSAWLPLERLRLHGAVTAAAANVPDKEIDGFRQVGNKSGTIGQPLPGVAGACGSTPRHSSQTDRSGKGCFC